VMAGCEGLDSFQEKAEWVRGAIDRLDQLVPDQETRMSIMTRCSCPCFDTESIAKLRDEYRRSKDIDKILELTYKNPFYVKPVRDGNAILLTKAPFDAEKHQQANTDKERRFHYCHCEYAKAAIEKISPTHCLCGAGWYKHIFEGILERPVRVEVLESVMQGDDVCRIAVHI